MFIITFGEAEKNSEIMFVYHTQDLLNLHFVVFSFPLE